MNKWKVFSVFLGLSLVLVLLADNLLVVPKLVQNKHVKVGTCVLNLPFDWYFSKTSANECLVSSVSEEKMIFGIVASEERNAMNFKLVQKAMCKEGECSFQYKIEREDVLEIKSPYGTTFASMDIFFLKNRRWTIYYMGDLADKYGIISQLISNSRILQKEPE